MRATAAYAELLQLNRPVVRTSEAAARLRLPKYAATKILKQLADDGVVVLLRRGLWALTRQVDPYTLPEYLTAPYPSYISTWTALYQHGMIDQVPRSIYVASLDRARRLHTPVGLYVIQHVGPAVFGGFRSRNGVRMATPEKALFDAVYITGARGVRFTYLPELELAPSFRRGEIRRWVRRIPAKRLRTIVTNRLEEILSQVEQG